jgi:folate-binding protein YgfZ
MKLRKLNKIVFSIQNNAVKFLNGLTSNAMDRPQNAFLNVHGRIIVTFEQVRINDDTVLIAVEKEFSEALLEHLDQFARLGGVRIDRRDDNVYYDPGGEYRAGEGEFVVPQPKGHIIITPKSPAATVSDEEFTLFRVSNNLPVQGIDYRDEFLLNVDDERYVSFTKGCFLGQEPVSKVHSRSKPTWKLTVCSEDECDEESKKKMTSRVRDPRTGRTMGFVFVRNQ